MTTWQWLLGVIILIDMLTAAYYDLFKDDDVKCIKFYLFGIGLYIIGFM